MESVKVEQRYCMAAAALATPRASMRAPLHTRTWEGGRVQRMVSAARMQSATCHLHSLAPVVAATAPTPCRLLLPPQVKTSAQTPEQDVPGG